VIHHLNWECSRFNKCWSDEENDTEVDDVDDNTSENRGDSKNKFGSIPVLLMIIVNRSDVLPNS
jgi:hypothetical protein